MTAKQLLESRKNEAGKLRVHYKDALLAVEIAKLESIIDLLKYNIKPLSYYEEQLRELKQKNGIEI